jgi:hypothetical protein
VKTCTPFVLKYLSQLTISYNFDHSSYPKNIYYKYVNDVKFKIPTTIKHVANKVHDTYITFLIRWIIKVIKRINDFDTEGVYVTSYDSELGLIH